MGNSSKKQTPEDDSLLNRNDQLSFQVFYNSLCENAKSSPSSNLLSEEIICRLFPSLTCPLFGSIAVQYMKATNCVEGGVSYKQFERFIALGCRSTTHVC